MTETTQPQTTAAADLPTENPSSVIITCPMACELHGWSLNHAYDTDPVYKQIEGARDDNGYNIYVTSPLRQRSVWLSTNEYKLIN